MLESMSQQQNRVFGSEFFELAQSWSSFVLWVGSGHDALKPTLQAAPTSGGSTFVHWIRSTQPKAIPARGYGGSHVESGSPNVGGDAMQTGYALSYLLFTD
jgi:hypothetical protein